MEKLISHDTLLLNSTQLIKIKLTLNICLFRDAGLTFYSEKLKDKQI